MTHAGDSYNCDSVEGIKAVAAREREATLECARALRTLGHACPVVSVGSTPTATFGESFAGVTEVRVGVYVFKERYMTLWDGEQLKNFPGHGARVGHKRPPELVVKR